jgi:TolB protein
MRRLLLLVTVVAGAGGPAAGADPPPDLLVGYTELRTDQPGGRHANVATMRAAIVRADGTGRRALAEDLAADPDTWTLFAGWSLEGRVAIIGRGWESPANAAWEEEHKTFRFTADGYLFDSCVLDCHPT